MCRPAYVEALRAYLAEHRDELCDEHQAKLDRNPLRVLDCKRPECRAVAEDAPRLVDFLVRRLRGALRTVHEGLDAAGDRATTWTTSWSGASTTTPARPSSSRRASDAAQNAVGGGGRYDGLVEQLGGPADARHRLRSGIERMLLACDAEGAASRPRTSRRSTCSSSTSPAGRRRASSADELRRAGLGADRAFDGRSLEGAAEARPTDRAPRSRCIVGPDELAAGDGDASAALRTTAGRPAGESPSVARSVGVSSRCRGETRVESVRARLTAHEPGD